MGATNKDSLRRESWDTVYWHRIIGESKGGSGGSREGSGRSSYLHTPVKNPPPISGKQAYIAYLPGSISSEGRAALKIWTKSRDD